MSVEERHLARFRNPDIMIDDHGFLLLSGTFEGEGFSSGLGRVLDNSARDCIAGILGVFGAERLQQCKAFQAPWSVSR